MSENILKNLKEIQNRIDIACRQVGRDSKEIKLLLATKTVSTDHIQLAIDQGYTLIGENKVQEAMKKHEVLKNQNLQWHIIGHLQTNKVKFVTQFSDVVQSIDRIKLAQKLQNRMELDQRKNIDVFIQVNTSYEKKQVWCCS